MGLGSPAARERAERLEELCLVVTRGAYDVKEDSPQLVEHGEAHLRGGGGGVGV